LSSLAFPANVRASYGYLCVHDVLSSTVSAGGYCTVHGRGRPWPCSRTRGKGKRVTAPLSSGIVCNYLHSYNICTFVHMPYPAVQARRLRRSCQGLLRAPLSAEYMGIVRGIIPLTIPYRTSNKVRTNSCPHLQTNGCRDTRELAPGPRLLETFQNAHNDILVRELSVPSRKEGAFAIYSIY
jgi:hypothetical protein